MDWKTKESLPKIGDEVYICHGQYAFRAIRANKENFIGLWEEQKDKIYKLKDIWAWCTIQERYN